MRGRWARKSSSRASDVGKGHPDYYQDLRQPISPRGPKDAIYINQFENPANPYAHEQTTAPEILRQMNGDIDAIVVGVGSGGTLTGIGRYMCQYSPKTRWCWPILKVRSSHPM